MISILLSLSLLGAMVVATRQVPTAGEVRAAFEQAQRFYASGAYDQGIERYRHVAGSDSRFLKMDSVRVEVGQVEAPLRDVALYQIGNCYLKMAAERAELAAKALQAAERDSLLAVAHGLYEQASAGFLQAESGTSVEALRALARSQATDCWYAMKEYGQVIEEARTLLARYPDSPQVEKAVYDIGWAHYQREEYSESIAAFESLVDRFHTGYRAQRALFQIGEAYFQLERHAEAVTYYRRLVDAQRIGRMSEQEVLRMKRDKLAGLVDETALEIAAKALIRIGLCYEQLGQHGRAVEAFQAVSRDFADERRLAEEAYLREADMHYRRGDFAATIAVYERAIEGAPDAFAEARIQLLLANRYFETGHFVESVREYDRYRRVHGDRAAQVGLPLAGVGLQIARAWMADAQERTGADRDAAYRQAETELRHTLRLFPGSSYDIEVRFNLGLALMYQGLGDQALALFAEVVEAAVTGGYRQSALFQIARLRHEREEPGEARAIYRQLLAELEGRPEAEVARFELGLVERDAGSGPAALEAFLGVGPASQLFARSRLEAGQLLVQQGQVERAVAVLEEGATAERDPEARALFDYLLGAALSQRGDYEQALAHFDAALAKADTTFAERVAYGRGATLFRLGRHAEAADVLGGDWGDPALAASARRLRAAALTDLGQVDAALQAYRELILTSGDEVERAEHRLALAEVAYRRGRYAEAVAAAEELLADSFHEVAPPPDRPYAIREKAHWLLADASLRGGDPQRSFDAATAGLRADPGGFYAAEFMFLQGLAALQLERYEESAARLEELLERDPGHDSAGEAWYYLGYAYFHQTSFSRAIAAFARVVEEYPNLAGAPDAAFRIAECQYNLGRYEEARQSYEAVIARSPGGPLEEQATYNIAWCLMELASAGGGAPEGESVRAAFEAYVRRFPGGLYAARALYTLGELSFNAGQYPEAYERFTRVVRDYPGSVEAQQAEGAIPELREALSYRQYSQMLDRFEQARAEGGAQNIRAVIEGFEGVWREYPDTAGGIAARVNVGVCYQRLHDWERAVAVFDEILAEGERGNPRVTSQVQTFVEQRRAIARKRL